jgi:hypothetical protein
MSSRSIAGQLLRLLDGLTAPVCLFDDDRTLVFANRACGEWLEVPLDRLIGRTAAYTSTAADEGQTAVDRLCPPPDAFAGRRLEGVVYAVSNGQLRRRGAVFFPLDGGASSVPVLMLAASSDCDADDAPPPAIATPARTADDPALLHERLIRFQTEQTTRHRLERFVGDSPAMQLARSQARAAIASGASAVIVGPAGSGREELARMIHYATVELAQTERHEPRSKLLLPIDGSLLTGEVLASAVAALSAQGRTAAGTILILHIDRIPLDLQTEMVRVFMQRFMGLRFLATSETVPDALMARGELHPLVAAAVGTLVIRLPPLADRREDIPLLLQRTVEELNAERQRQIRGFAPEAVDALVAYPWPGNATELVQIVAESARRAAGPLIMAADLTQRLNQAAGAARRPPRTDAPIVLPEFLAGIERELIERALSQAKGNKARAARLLGLTRPRLYRRMVQLGLEKGAQPLAATPSEERGPLRHITRKEPRRDKQTKMPTASTDGPAGAASQDMPEYIEDIPFEEQPE